MDNDISQTRRRRRPRRAGILAAATAIALLTAACSGNQAAGNFGGAPAAGSASPSTGRGGSSVAGRPTAPQKQLAFSDCMRSHGVPGVPTSFPSPVPGPPPSKPDFKPVTATGPNPGSPQWQAAQHACRSLMPSPHRVPG